MLYARIKNNMPSFIPVADKPCLASRQGLSIFKDYKKKLQEKIYNQFKNKDF